MTEVEPDFFIVNVASGQPSHARFNVLKKYDFPVLNRGKTVTREDIKKYLQMYSKEPTYLKFSNFNLLILLSHFIDVDVSTKKPFINQTDNLQNRRSNPIFN